jgi:large conductance mechanosensitive channel
MTSVHSHDGGFFMHKEFIAFLKQYGILGLAIAVVIGGKVNNVVTSLVNDIITPGILQPVLQKVGAENIAQLNYNGIFYGKFISAVIDFGLVALIVFLFSKKVLKEEVVNKK